MVATARFVAMSKAKSARFMSGVMGRCGGLP